MEDYQYQKYRAALVGYSLPLAFLDLDRMEENIGFILKEAGKKRIRIASKSIRCVPLIRHILESGDRFQGVMCFSVPEALFLSEEHGLDDLLVAYPAWDASSLMRVGGELASGKRITLMVDCVEHVSRLDAIAQGTDWVFPVCIDMDLSVSWPGLHFGVRRSPLRSLEAFLELARFIGESPRVELEGVMGYEAQVAGVGDWVPGKPLRNGIVRLLKQHSIRRIARQRRDWLKALKDRGIKPRFVNGGGTGSLRETAREDIVTEVTAGSGFFTSVLFDHYRGFHGKPAAGFALEVTRKPASGIVTCAGGGYPASGAAGRDRLPTPWLPEGLKLLPSEGAGEVQTPVCGSGALNLDLGDPILFRHAKAGEMCERFHEILIISSGRVVDRYPTYRGEGKCFL
ncbi:amino acid deaminase/aldolase [Salinithrix halophila]|uniref:Amino acid deaminase/aldolase n=2 Tax=Salinithrix halophila TaxID=1485204 RepID=A0ABV8JLR0_9BACL